MTYIVYEWPESQFWLERLPDYQDGIFAIEHSEQLNNPAVCVRSDLVADVLNKE